MIKNSIYVMCFLNYKHNTNNLIIKINSNMIVLMIKIVNNLDYGQFFKL